MGAHRPRRRASARAASRTCPPSSPASACASRRSCSAIAPLLDAAGRPDASDHAAPAPSRRLAPAPARRRALAAVLPFTAARFARALVMPNLKPPMTTTAALAGVPRAHPRRAAGRAGLRAADDAVPHRPHAAGRRSAAARASGFVVGAKLYPGRRHHALRRRRHLDRPRLGDARGDGRGRPGAAGARRGDRRRTSTSSTASASSSTACSRGSSSACPACKVVFEHVTTAAAVEFVRCGAARRRRDDHAAAPAHEPQRDVRRRHPPAPLLPARAEARARPRGAGRGRHRRRSALLPRHRQRAARAPHQGGRLRLRRHLLRACGHRAVCRGVRGRRPARPPRGLRLRARRRLLRRCRATPGRDHARRARLDRAAELSVRRRRDSCRCAPAARVGWRLVAE